ncbi:glycosyltransferase [Catellatospora bangladeshensis]
MKILFSSLGSHGHTYPLLPLAAAAAAQGHDVTYATSAEFAGAVERLGLRHLTAGLSQREALAATFGPGEPGRPGAVPEEVIAEVFGRVLPRSFHDDLVPFLAEWRPDLVVHEIGNPGAGLAARTAGVPALCHGFGRMWSADALFSRTPGPLVDYAAELGVDLPAEDPIVLGNTYLDVCPPSVQDQRFLAANDIVPLRPVPFAEPGELPGWVTAHDRPLVYLTLGTVFGDPGVLRAAIAGLAAVAGARVLVATGPTIDVAELGEVPDHVELLEWVPQADLLPHTDLVVHHGGSGTTMGAFSVGVPQLVLPQGADQFGNADAVVEHGLGEQLVGEGVTAEAVAERARRLLADDAVLDAARAVAAEVAAMPSPAEVAARLPEYTR